MQLYPHWLDGEFVRITSNTEGAEKCIKEMIRALKLHALLGTQFIFNDVQVFDSAAVHDLFADDELYNFVNRDRSFLDLRVEPDLNLGDSPYALAARGFTRAIAPGWISSAFFKDKKPIIQLAEEIIKEVLVNEAIEPDRQSQAERDYPEYAIKLKAARRAVRYFGSRVNSKQMVAVPGDRKNYYKILWDLLEKLNNFADDICNSVTVLDEIRPLLLSQVHEDIANVGDTINWIDKQITDPGARKARSRVLAILDEDHEPDSAKRERIWNNVVQAWNYATQMTLQPDGGSVGTLPGAASPAPYMDTPTDMLVPVELDKLTGPMAGVADLPVLPIQLDEIGWKQIAKIREATAETMNHLTLARNRNTGNIDELSEPLRNHLDAVGRILQKPKKISMVPYVMKITGAAAGSAVIAAFGDPTLKSYIAPIAAGITVSMNIGADICRDTGAWRERRALTNTLYKAAVGKS